MELFQGKDGKIRVAKVRTSKGVLERPLQRLFPVELSMDLSTQIVKKKIPTPKEIPEEEDSPVVEAITTKSGRQSKRPNCYGQWNQ